MLPHVFVLPVGVCPPCQTACSLRLAVFTAHCLLPMVQHRCHACGSRNSAHHRHIYRATSSLCFIVHGHVFAWFTAAVLYTCDATKLIVLPTCTVHTPIPTKSYIYTATVHWHRHWHVIRPLMYASQRLANTCTRMTQLSLLTPDSE